MGESSGLTLVGFAVLPVSVTCPPINPTNYFSKESIDLESNGHENKQIKRRADHLFLRQVAAAALVSVLWHYFKVVAAPEIRTRSADFLISDCRNWSNLAPVSGDATAPWVASFSFMSGNCKAFCISEDSRSKTA